MALIALVAAGLLAGAAGAATTERVVVDPRTGLAIGGFDPVAYFTEGAALIGDADFEVTQAGAIWRFRNEGDRAFFAARPDIYAPQFGGYDPIDVARGVAVAGNAVLWLVAGERLFLFSREDNRKAFAGDPQRWLREAKQRWPELLNQLAQ
jgi:hypothetical protein